MRGLAAGGGWWRERADFRGCETECGGNGFGAEGDVESAG